MKIHFLQHVDFEGPAYLAQWSQRKGLVIQGTRVYSDDKYPDLSEFDLLVVLGGPMNIYQEKEYPWLIKEKQFIKQAVEGGKKILGICLGAQLLADILGAKVVRNKQKEIGWHCCITEPLWSKQFPSEFEAFHWHGDTFYIPEGADRVFASEACANQGFIYENRIMALQFHLESTPGSIRDLVKNCREELSQGGQFIQQEAEILSNSFKCLETNRLMDLILDKISG